MRNGEEDRHMRRERGSDDRRNRRLSGIENGEGVGDVVVESVPRRGVATLSGTAGVVGDHSKFVTQPVDLIAKDA
jgi:hypothetical protein